MLLAMGRDDGVGQFNGLRLPRCLVALAKSRDLLLWKSWRKMQQTYRPQVRTPEDHCDPQLPQFPVTSGDKVPALS